MQKYTTAREKKILETFHVFDVNRDLVGGSVKQSFPLRKKMMSSSEIEGF